MSSLSLLCSTPSAGIIYREKMDTYLKKDIII